MMYSARWLTLHREHVEHAWGHRRMRVISARMYPDVSQMSKNAVAMRVFDEPKSLLSLSFREFVFLIF